MHRIDSTTKQVDKFGSGKHGHTAGNPGTGVPPTRMTAEWHDGVQEELAHVVEQSGQALVKADNTQLLRAIEHAVQRRMFETSFRLSATPASMTTVMGMAYGAGVLVAVGGNTASHGAAWSIDNGVSWNDVDIGFGANWVYGLVYANNIFVAYGAGGKLSTSSDGKTWTAQAPGFSTDIITSVLYSSTLSLWIAAGYNGKISTATTPTGTWTARTSGFGTDAIYDLAENAGTIVAVGETNKISSSTNGTSWTARTSNITGSIRFVAYGGGAFVAIATNAANQLARSTDGVTWVAKDPLFGSEYGHTVRFINDRFIAMGNNGKASSSTDGNTWAALSHPLTSNIADVVYLYGCWLMVAAGTGTPGAGCPAAYSWDAVTWVGVKPGTLYARDNSWGESAAVAHDRIFVFTNVNNELNVSMKMAA